MEEEKKEAPVDTQESGPEQEVPKQEPSGPVEAEASDARQEQPTALEEKLRRDNERLYMRVKQAEKLAKKLKDAQQAQAEAPEHLQRLEDKVDLQGQGYDASEIEFIRRTRKPGQSTEDALKDPFVQAALQDSRLRKSVEAATPSPSSRTNTSFNKNLTYAQTPPEQRAGRFGFEAWKSKRGSETGNM